MRQFMCYLLFSMFMTNTAFALDESNHVKNNHTKNVKKSVNWETNLNKALVQDAFKPIGHAVFSFLFWDLYKSKLLTTSGEFPLQLANEKLLYEIEYFKSISGESLVEKTVEQWQHLGYSTKDYQPYLVTLKRIWPDIKAGDTLTLVMNDANSAFYHNKIFVGAIDNAEFGPLFLDIWLSKKTSEPALRRSLLGIK